MSLRSAIRIFRQWGLRLGSRACGAGGERAPRGASEGWGYGLAARCGVGGIRNTSLPDSCSFLSLCDMGNGSYHGVATPYPAWGFHPQTPSPLRGGLKSYSIFPQLSRSDSVVKGAGNSVPCRELEGRALNVPHLRHFLFVTFRANVKSLSSISLLYFSAK